MWGEDAARFLAKVLPWPASDSDAGYCNLHWSNDPWKEGQKPWWNGRPYRTVAEMVSFAGWLVRQSNIRDIYFCTSLQARTLTNKHGKVVALRSQANTLASKILFLDIDVKEAPKGYGSPMEALTVLGSFVKEMKLPFPSAIIHSGGGLHTYWALPEPLPPSEWQPLADQLRTAALQFGLRFDTNVMEIARILRVPQTLNHKTNPPKPVRLLHLE